MWHSEVGLEFKQQHTMLLKLSLAIGIDEFKNAYKTVSKAQDSCELQREALSQGQSGTHKGLEGSLFAKIAQCIKHYTSRCHLN